MMREATALNKIYIQGRHYYKLYYEALVIYVSMYIDDNAIIVASHQLGVGKKSNWWWENKYGESSLIN